MADKRVVVAEFENVMDAEIAKGHLESAGINAEIVKDDAGGMFPSLQQSEGVRLVISESDLARAQQTLEERAEE